MESHSTNCLTHQGQPRYIHDNCHYTTTNLQVEAVDLRRHFMGLAMVLFTITPATIIFNLLTISTFIYKIKFRVASNILLCALAFTDLFKGLTVIPVMGTVHLFLYLNKKDCCLFFMSGMVIMFTFLLMTFATMTLMSIDRYSAIFYPFKYSARIDKQTLIIRILAPLWTSVIFLGAFTVFTAKLKLVWIALEVASSIFLPLTFFVHVRIFFEVRRRRKEICFRRVSLRACSHDPGTTHCPGATH